jgi:hypothetical protein
VRNLSLSIFADLELCEVLPVMVPSLAAVVLRERGFVFLVSHTSLLGNLRRLDLFHLPRIVSPEMRQGAFREHSLKFRQTLFSNSSILSLS